MSHTKRYTPFVLGSALALGAAWFIWKSRRDVGSLNIWQQVLIKRHGAEKAQQLPTAIRQQNAMS